MTDPDPLARVTRWPGVAAAGWIAGDREERTGPNEVAYPWASVTKVVTAMAIWIAVEEGSVDWGDAAGPPGSTLGHLLAHASGLAPDSDQVLAPPGRRRIYSNQGIETAAAHVTDRTGLPFAEYATEAVLHPLNMRRTVFSGSPASGATGPLSDLLRLGRELARPRLVGPDTAARVTSVAFPDLAGVLPGFGRQDHNDWGLGVEIRDSKQPHWTGRLNSQATFGHFGQSGAFIWFDPAHQLLLASVSDRPFGAWATEAWPDLSDAVLSALTGS